MSLKYVLLTQLARAEQSGYDITKSFDASVGHFWQASHQQVYRELGKLLGEGLISQRVEQQSTRPDRKLYKITTAGIDHILAWLRQTPAATPVRDALLVRLNAAAEVEPTAIGALIKSAEAETRDVLAVYRGIERDSFDPPPARDCNPQRKMLYAALRKGIGGASEHLRWLRETAGLFPT